MMERSRSDLGRAVERFSAGQRTASTVSEATSVPAQRRHVTHADPSSASGPLASDTVEAALEAFMNSREEGALEFVAGFLQLSSADKEAALAQIEGTDDDGHAAEELCESVPQSEMPVSAHADLRRRLQLHELQTQQAAQAQHRAPGVLHSRAEAPPPASRVHRGARRVSRSAGIGAAAAAAGATDGGAAAPLWTGEIAGDELETVEVGEGTHTGNLVTFFNKGVTEVSTSFDNFVDFDVGRCAPLRGSGAEDPIDAAPQVPVPHTHLTLDEILSVDGVDAEDVSPSRIEGPRVPVTQPTEETLSCADLEPHKRRDSDAWSVASSAESVELPGLEDAQGGVDCQSIPSQPRARLMDVTAQLHDVVEEPDDCVQSFTLDPLFDYDADLFGAAFLSGKKWRCD
ncbi:hypothetical protein NESM_000223100 [Novymonas esmeraldas]|uniref:Uncharacterized protein n=1 Tax=Novymonas esmeraldas TaxID=1808958 RepID=A0AAW0F4S4_9TRYP